MRERWFFQSLHWKNREPLPKFDKFKWNEGEIRARSDTIDGGEKHEIDQVENMTRGERETCFSEKLKIQITAVENHY